MIEGLLCGAQGSGSNSNATRVERGHRDLEPFPLLADQVTTRYFAILEEDFARMVRKTHRSLAFAERQSGGSLLYYERADALGAFSFFGHRHHDVDIGFAAVSDPYLLAAQYVFIAPKLGSSIDIGRIGSGVRLGKREGSEQLGSRHRG